MLTVEMLQQNTQLSGLTVEQFNAIAEMSRNDENTVIGTKIGALHGQYDSDILSITGVAKNSGEKSYDYLKRVLNANKTDLETLATTKQELATAKAKAPGSVTPSAGRMSLHISFVSSFMVLFFYILLSML
jgi:hypothetical protein